MGHVFVANADLTSFACDHWLLPTDEKLTVMQYWGDPVNGSPKTWSAGTEAPWPEQDGELARVVPLQDVFPSYRDTRRPWLGRLGRPRLQATWVLGLLEAFVKAAFEDGHRMLDRPRMLLAAPLLGTGAGGGFRIAGEIIEDLLLTAYELADAYDVDIAVIGKGEANYAAVQAARRKVLTEDSELRGFHELGVEQMLAANALAELASAGRLAIFMGAGVSMSAGLPSWNALLDQLAARAGLPQPERDRLADLEPLDRAQIVAHALGGADKVGPHIRAVLAPHRYCALSHTLLAGLPVNEVITTNYDRLFEEACRGAGVPISVLPYAPASQRRWLLKMHGCLDHPEDIVLTRQAYVRYAERNAALAGIVQATLITKHMLFVGFSLTDDNFHRIVDAVRRASRVEPGGPRLGTAVLLAADPLLQRLWDRDLDWVHTGEAEDELPEAARRFEIFLDYLSYRTAVSAHLLHDRFKGLLTPEEEALREVLVRLRTARMYASRAPGWPLVEELLRSFGDNSDNS